MTAKRLLPQIERGLDGVTPGEWHNGCLGSGSTCQCTYVLSESYMGAICTVHIGNGLPIGEGGNDAPPADEAAANMRHIARCSPDTMREIIAYVRETEARATAAEATVTALQEALKVAEAERDNLENALDSANFTLDSGRALNADLADKLAKAAEALEPFSKIAGEMFARNWNARQVVVGLDNPDEAHRVRAADFFRARKSLTIIRRTK